MQQRMKAWISEAIRQHRASAVICMDPSMLFMMTDDLEIASLEKLRGGVYVLFGIPWIVSLPLTAYHKSAKAKDVAKLNEGFTEKGDFEDFMNDEMGSDDDDEDSETDSDDNGDTGDSDSDSTFSSESAARDKEENYRPQWFDPVIVPMGRVTLEFDFAKAGILLNRQHVYEVQNGKRAADLLGSEEPAGSVQLPGLITPEMH
jgi:hypothetical protein